MIYYKDSMDMHSAFKSHLQLFLYASLSYL